MKKQKKSDKLPLGIKIILGLLIVGIILGVILIFSSIHSLVFDNVSNEGIDDIMHLTGIFFTVIALALIFISGLFLYKRKNLGRILTIILFSIIILVGLQGIFFGDLSILKGVSTYSILTIIFFICTLISILYLILNKKVKKIYSFK